MKRRQEGDYIPQGFSYTEPSGHSRLHLWYREGEKIVHFAVPQKWETYLGYPEGLSGDICNDYQKTGDIV